jgi:hypothetical protein
LVGKKKERKKNKEMRRCGTWDDGAKRKKKEKRNGEGGVWWEKGEGKRKKRKKLKGKKLNWIYLFVHFV